MPIEKDHLFQGFTTFKEKKLERLDNDYVTMIEQIIHVYNLAWDTQSLSK